MNKIYGILTIFAFAGLLLPTSVMQVEASSDLDYMLKIAEKAKRYIKHNIDEMENNNFEIFNKKNNKTPSGPFSTRISHIYFSF